MLAEQTLSKFPVLGELPPLLEDGVHPGDPIGLILILDAVASL